MKKLILCFLSALLSLGALAQEPYPELGAKLEEYFTALAGEPASVQNKECDFLIASCRDSLVRQYVALKVYDHYLQSKIMGDDAVAVHVAQEWFLSGKVAMAEEMDLLNARVFVEFNKSSLIGMQAPALSTFAPDGSYVKVPGEGYSVLFFYDTGCATCKVESARLKALVGEGKYPVNVYAIYVGQDGTSWKAYVADFKGVTHVWSPEPADWQRLYGIAFRRNSGPWTGYAGAGTPAGPGIFLRALCLWRGLADGRPGPAFCCFWGFAEGFRRDGCGRLYGRPNVRGGEHGYL